jgi:hypothetical protein
MSHNKKNILEWVMALLEDTFDTNIELNVKNTIFNTN